jgi:hypothetical protein
MDLYDDDDAPPELVEVAGLPDTEGDLTKGRVPITIVTGTSVPNTPITSLTHV